MSLAKRLFDMVLEGRTTEGESEAVLAGRDAIWLGRERSGQMILPLFSEDDSEPSLSVFVDKLI